MEFDCPTCKAKTWDAIDKSKNEDGSYFDVYCPGCMTEFDATKQADGSYSIRIL